jgi:erythromycin esterase-like protein
MQNKTRNSYRLSGLLLLLPLLATPARAQSKFGAIQAYVKQHTQPIATIDSAAPDNADLAAIGQAIGEARVVMLGEQDHGDGATFQAKTRLVKYLHEQKGFNVLVWESDFFALNHGWDSVPKQPAAMRAFVRGNIYPYWTACQQAEALLYDYLPSTYATARPLHLAGLDNQLYGAYSRRALPGYLRGWLGQQAAGGLRGGRAGHHLHGRALHGPAGPGGRNVLPGLFVGYR